jgi:[ribosomal protein S5]-alanine N-acetyltransferase
MMIVLETSNLLIREHEYADLQEMHSLLSDKEVMKYLDFGSETIEDSEKNIRQCIEESCKTTERTKYYFAICEKNSKDYIGEIGYTVINISDSSGICNLGFFIHKIYWNKGYATEAVKGLVEFIFLKTKLHKIELGCIRENRASEKVMIKSGFVKEGELLQHSLISGRWHDRLLYGITKNAWASRYSMMK